MAHDVFISYAFEDKPTADAVCATLEAQGLRCWIAPRDILPGADWPESIINALENSRALILVFSSHANRSQQIKKEVERAVNHGLPVIPVRIEDVAPSKTLEYFISTPHWLDAISPPLERHLQQLARTIKLLLHDNPDAPVKAVEPGSAGATEVVTAVKKPTRKRSPLLLAGVGTGVAILGIGTVLWWQSSTKPVDSGDADKPLTPATIPIASTLASPETSAEFVTSLRQAKGLITRRQFTEARAKYDEILLKNPENAEAWAQRGIAKAEQGETTAAIKDLTEALRLDPEMTLAYGYRAWCGAIEEDESGAMRDASVALRLDPNLPIALAARASLFYARGDRANGLADCNRAIQADPSSHHAHVAKAILSAEDDIALAIAEASEAIRLVPDYSYAYTIRAYVQTFNSQLNEAEADSRQAVQLGPNDAMTLAIRGLVLGLRKEHDAAIEAAVRAVDLRPDGAQILAYRAITYLLVGETDLAMADADRALAINPSIFISHQAKAMVHNARGEWDLAIAAIDQALKIRPRAATALMYRATAYAQKDDYDRAIEDLSEALRISPFDITIRNTRAQLYKTYNDNERAIGDMSEIIRRQPGVAYWLRERGNLYMEIENYDLAMADLEAALKIDPLDVIAINNIGYMIQKQGKDAEAIPYFDRVIKLDSSQTMAFSNRADARRKLRQFAPALDDYAELIRLAGDTVTDWPHYWRGWIFMETGRPADALADLSEAIRINSNDADNLRLRGDAYAQLGEDQKALDDFNHAVAIKPGDINLLSSRFQTEVKVTKDLEAGVKSLETIIRTIPENVAAGQFYAGLLIGVGRPQDALEEFNQLLKRNPTHTGLLYNRADLYFSLWRLEEAAGDLLHAGALEPDSLELYRLLIRVQTAGGAYEAALDNAERALTFAAEDVDLMVSIARLKLALGKPAEAIVSLDKAIEINSKRADVLRTRAFIQQQQQNAAAAEQDLTAANAIDGLGGTVVVKVEEVFADGPGGKAGIQVGDIIEQYHDFPVTSYAEILTATLLPGDAERNLVVLRGGEKVSLKVPRGLLGCTLSEAKREATSE